PTQLWPFCLMLAATGALAAAPAGLLLRSEEADKHVDYRGIKKATVALGDQMAVATLKVVHLKPDLTRTVYFAPPALAGTIVIRDGNHEWKFCPKDGVWEKIGRCPVRCSETNWRGVLHNYDLRLVGTEKIAGRDAYVLYAVPRSRGEPAHRMWVDRDCYLVLGTQTESQSGAVLRSSRYVSLQINPGDIDRDLFKVEGKVKAAERPVGSPDFTVMKPSYLPKGYRHEATSYLRINGSSCVHLRFTNGANAVSIFQHRASRGAPDPKIDSNVTNMLTWTRAGIRLTIMGDLPRGELQRIADSIK
ncbi:MAG: MucB/RseB C-terminal domain-containing protein, partial [Armatimonadota bacterium]